MTITPCIAALQPSPLHYPSRSPSPLPALPIQFQTASTALGIVMRSDCNDAAVNAAVVNGLVADMGLRVTTPGAQVSVKITSCSILQVCCQVASW